MSFTLIIVIVTCLVSLLAFQNKELFNRLQFNAYLINHNRQWYRFFSYGLIHADFIHLAVNMYVLYTFGEITNYFYTDFFGVKGSYYYLLLYAASLFTSTIYSFELHKRNSWYNAVGASGAVSAVVFTSILFSPTVKMYLLFLPIPIPAVIFGALYLVYSYVMAKKGKDNIGHDAHFFGALFGVMFTIVLDKQIAVNFYNQIVETYFR